MNQARVGVVGAGTMGVGVAHLFAGSGHDVVLVDTTDEVLATARERIAHNVRYYPLVQPGFPRIAASAVLSRITCATDPGGLAEVDLVVENATESWPVKQAVYRDLARVCRRDCVIAVNTSAMSITRLAALVAEPARVLGAHFMNPAPLKPLVELVRGHHTSEAALTYVLDLLRSSGKDAVVVHNAPGFVTNRVMMLTVNEAVFLLQERVADTAADIDRLFRDCFGHRMGPLETADLIGLDTVLLSLEVIQDGFADCKYRPAPLLRELVAAGRLGRKSGHGFYDYGQTAPAVNGRAERSTTT
jgi:3-hydroxybutyryl-CoA dehydrogenase